MSMNNACPFSNQHVEVAVVFSDFPKRGAGFYDWISYYSTPKVQLDQTNSVIYHQFSPMKSIRHFPNRFTFSCSQILCKVLFPKFKFVSPSSQLSIVETRSGGIGIVSCSTYSNIRIKTLMLFQSYSLLSDTSSDNRTSPWSVYVKIEATTKVSTRLLLLMGNNWILQRNVVRSVSSYLLSACELSTIIDYLS